METIVPMWMVRDLELWIRERRTGTLGFRFRDGEVTGVQIDELKRRPALDPGSKATCPRCAQAAAVIDNGRRLFCDRCRTVTVVEPNGARRALPQEAP